MNQPAEPYGDEEEVDYTVERKPDEPDFVADPIPMKERISLYFTSQATDYYTILHLVWLKTCRAYGVENGVAECDHNEQDTIADKAAQLFHQGSNFEGQRIPWTNDAYGMGQYVASGILHQDEFDLCFYINDNEAEDILVGNQVSGFPKMPLSDDHPARKREGKVYEGAKDRFEKNRQRFKGRVVREERERNAAKEERERDAAKKVQELMAAQQERRRRRAAQAVPQLQPVQPEAFHFHAFAAGRAADYLIRRRQSRPHLPGRRGP